MKAMGRFLLCRQDCGTPGGFFMPRTDIKNADCLNNMLMVCNYLRSIEMPRTFTYQLNESKKIKIMTTQEKIQKMFVGQPLLSGVEWHISGDFVYFTNPTESKKYQDLGRVRISDKKAIPFRVSNSPTRRDNDAMDVLKIAVNALNEVFPTVEAVEETTWKSSFLK